MPVSVFLRKEELCHVPTVVTVKQLPPGTYLGKVITLSISRPRVCIPEAGTELPRMSVSIFISVFSTERDENVSVGDVLEA